MKLLLIISSGLLNFKYFVNILDCSLVNFRFLADYDAIFRGSDFS